MLTGIILNVLVLVDAMLTVVKLSVVMLSVNTVKYFWC
jgi:hypothetical protein